MSDGHFAANRFRTQARAIVVVLGLFGLQLSAGCTKDKGTSQGVDPEPGSWVSLPTEGAPPPLFEMGAAWTGTEMLVWGIQSTSGYPAFGGAYSPSLSRWRTISSAGAPSGREDFSAVWTGEELIVWGGFSPFIEGPACCVMNSGGRYNPATNSWSPTSLVNAPRARRSHACVWTGTEMIVWGGEGVVDGMSVDLYDGGIYDPAQDSWRPLSDAGAPICSPLVTIWTGTEMFIYGAGTKNGFLADSGGIYNPIENIWRAIARTGAAPRRDECITGAWTGTEVILWGTYGNVGPSRYNPRTDVWTQGSAVGQPLGTCGNACLWTGRELFIWGGHASFDYLREGGLYDPVADTWRSTALNSAPARRGFMAAVWTGTDVIVWGGFNLSTTFRDGARFRP